MNVSRATAVLAAIAIGGCSRGGGQDVAPRRRTLSVSDGAVSQPGPLGIETRIQRALAEGYADRPMPPAEFDHWMAEIAAGDPPPVRRAWLTTAIRRAPSGRLASVWSAMLPTEFDWGMRALAGRSRDSGAIELPPQLRSPTEPPGLALATVVARLHPSIAYAAPQDARLVAASIDDQEASARLLAASSVPLPDPAILDVVSSHAWPALARSLAARRDVEPVRWVAAMQITAHRCRVAPRQWCNAWRAVRDAAPHEPALTDALRLAAGDADAATGLPAPVSSALRCEDAVVVDRVAGVPDMTLRCALPGFEWMRSAAQAAVWGDSGGLPRIRAAALEVLRTAAHGQPQVLEAVAEAAVKLPPVAGANLIRTLSGERDPGVLAALLDGLVLHVQHARMLGAQARTALEHAPFELQEGPSLEARQHALALAQALHDPEPGDPGSNRALRAADRPDAAVLPMTRAVPMDIPPIYLRVTTDLGTFDLRLEPSEAPEAVAAVTSAARAHRYDGLTFHRVVPGFVTQGLDPRGDGYGGTDQPVPTEISIRPFERGTVGIPLAGLDTGGIQLFVVLADSPHLDGRYPWVGTVARGMDVVDGLLPQDRVLRVEILEAAQNDSFARTSPR